MRLNNKGIKPIFQFIYFILSLAALFGLFLVLSPIGSFTKIHGYLFLGGSAVVFWFIRYLGWQKFEYDSNGEVLNLRMSEIVLSDLFPKMGRQMDFPKYKLLKFYIRQGFIKKTLYLEITSRRNEHGKTTLKFNITYYSNKSIRKLKQSLNKVLESNKRRAASIEHGAKYGQ